MPPRPSNPETVAYRRIVDAHRPKVAERLRLLREVVSPVMSDAARRIGLLPTAWHEFETNKRELDQTSLMRFAVMYDREARSREQPQEKPGAPLVGQPILMWIVLGRADFLDARLQQDLAVKPGAEKYLRAGGQPAPPGTAANGTLAPAE